MKVKDLLSEAMPKWEKHPTRKGVLYRYVTQEDRKREAEEEKRKEQMKELKAENKKKMARLEKHKAGTLKLTKEEAWEIWDKIETVVGDCVPDGDPIDRLAHFIKQKFGIEGDVVQYLDQAVKKTNNGKSYDDYLIQSWDAYDEMLPKEGSKHAGEYGPFKGDFSGKNNPWR